MDNEGNVDLPNGDIHNLSSKSEAKSDDLVSKLGNSQAQNSEPHSQDEDSNSPSAVPNKHKLLIFCIVMIVIISVIVALVIELNPKRTISYKDGYATAESSFSRFYSYQTTLSPDPGISQDIQTYCQNYVFLVKGDNSSEFEDGCIDGLTHAYYVSIHPGASNNSGQSNSGSSG